MAWWIHVIVVGAMLFIAGIVLFLRGLRDKAVERLRSLREDEPLLQEMSANFSGFSSKRGGQIRGNCLLALYPDEIIFIMWAPRKVIRIPMRSVSHVDTVRNHAGRWLPYPQLHIVYTDETGAVDGVAWALSHPEHWVETVMSIVP